MDKGLLQKDLAKLIGVSEDTIRNWETNRFEPQTKYLPGVIDFLGFLPESLKSIPQFQNPLFLYRCKNNINQVKLAKIIGVDPGTISQIENNKRSQIQRTLNKVNNIILHPRRTDL